MKICFLTERMRLGFGVDLVVDEQARRLVGLGFEVVVVVMHADLVLSPRPYQLVVLNRLMPLGDFESEAWMKKALSLCNVRADLWVLHTPPFYDWLNYLDGPVILIEYGAPPGHFFAPIVGRHIDTMADKRLNELYGSLLPCDAIMSISHSIHNWLPETVQRNSTVIHLGCDHYPPVSQTDARDFRQTLDIRDEECLILWVGRMQIENDEQPYKGFQELLTLMPLIQRHIPDAKFVLVGRASDKDRRLLQNRGVTVLANQTSEEMACVYAAADVLINLSLWEGFNLALLEAQFQGTPVVAYDLGPHPEILRHNETGLLAKTPKDFFQSIVKIAGDQGLRETLGEQARTFAAGFTWKVSLDKFERLVLACVSKSPPRTEILDLRRKAAKNSQTAAAPPLELAGHVPTAKDILQLDGTYFVKAARQALLGQAPDNLAETPWLERLHRGSGKQGLLLAMADLAASRGFRPNVMGLRAELLSARSMRFLRRLTRRAEPRESAWTVLRDDLFVQYAFLVLLGREAEPAAINGWIEAFRSGRSRREMLAAIHFSDEGKGRPLSDPDLLRILRPDILERERLSNRGRGAKFWGRVREFVRRRAHINKPVPAFVADFQRWDALLGTTAHQVQTLGTMFPRLDALEARIDALRAEQAGLLASSAIVSASPSPAPETTFTPLAGVLRLGTSHIVLVAPGTVPDPLALTRLAEAVSTTNSDIVFGDEVELLEKAPFRRLRIHGPFSHDAFLRNPDLGGVIAVHEDLLQRMQWPSSIALTGPIVLQLVSLAHTMTYVPATLGERTRESIRAIRPAIADIRTYVGRIGRPALVAEDGSAGFDVRFPVSSRWKAAIIIVAKGGGGDVEQSLTSVRANTASDKFRLILAYPTGRSPVGHEPLIAMGGSETVLTFASDTPYGTMVNEAVHRAPQDCNLIVVMDAGVSPAAPDWLERLAESALVPSTGVVAPKTLYPDQSIRHVGMVIGLGDPCGYVGRFARSGSIDDSSQLVELDRLNGPREVSIVSRHCMMFRRSVFLDQGQFAKQLSAEAADIEFCCRLRIVGLSVLLDGRVAMLQRATILRWAREFPEDDLAMLKAKYGRLFASGERFWKPLISAADLNQDIRTVILPPVSNR